MARKKGQARKGRPTKLDDEPILLEMARASLTGTHPSDFALARAFAHRVDAASFEAAHRRLHSKFRKRRQELVQKAQLDDDR